VPKAPAVKVDAAAIERWITELRSVMWKDAGLLRDAAGLKRAQARLEGMMGEIPRGFSRRAVEARNLFLLAGVMVTSAAAREESRGAHYRNDFPKKGKTARHSVMEKGKLRLEA
jgi:L-aspartate oxidase